VYWTIRELHAWCALITVAVAAGGMFAATARDVARPVHRALAGGLLLLLITGLLLQFSFSAFTAHVRANLDVVLRDPTLRHWNVVHPLLAVVAIGAAWRGWRRDIFTRRRLAAITVTLALTTVLATWFS
jgi:hypothetical protein